jgi:hypothetical protein
MAVHDTIDEYLRAYPRLCAAMIALSGHELTPHGAAFLLRDAHERPRYDPGARALPVPTRERSLVARAYQRRHALRGYAAEYEHTLRMVPAATSTAWRDPPPRRVTLDTPMPLSQNMTLILTTEGFLNVDHACEYRLRYVDPSRTDAIWGIDVVLSNGTSHLIRHEDPGFAQLIDLFEEQGYTISTALKTGDRSP